MILYWSLTAGWLYSHHPLVERSEVRCRAAGGESVICFSWMLADTGSETEASVWRMFSVTVYLPSLTKGRQKEIKNSPTPLPESCGPGCPTLERGFWVRQKKDRKNIWEKIDILNMIMTLREQCSAIHWFFYILKYRKIVKNILLIDYSVQFHLEYNIL